ncbi:hypothetical protein BBP40_009468 [Aspergillus hancockii]|nr:hypothetical protein BBP40_009468 [Aspergillus hancockii]
MMATGSMGPHAKSVAIESWCLLSRRIRLGSWKQLQVDDGLMCMVLLTFTGVVYTVNQMAEIGEDPLMQEFPPSSRAVERGIYACKISVAMEQLSLGTLWLVKGCLLCIYGRLTLMTKERRVVKIIAVYVVSSFIILQILFWTVWCTPPQKYWGYPIEDFQCSSFFNHLIVSTIFNISSDLLMLGIPFPLFIRLQVPILMAALNKYYNFAEPYNLRFLRWYVAEVATAVYVSNVPLLWPLLRQLFHQLRTTPDPNRPSGPHIQIKPQQECPPFRTRSAYESNSQDSIMRVTDEDDNSRTEVHELSLFPTLERGCSAAVCDLSKSSPQRTRDITVGARVEVIHQYTNQ